MLSKRRASAWEESLEEVRRALSKDLEVLAGRADERTKNPAHLSADRTEDYRSIRRRRSERLRSSSAWSASPRQIASALATWARGRAPVSRRRGCRRRAWHRIPVAGALVPKRSDRLQVVRSERDDVGRCAGTEHCCQRSVRKDESEDSGHGEEQHVEEHHEMVAVRAEREERGHRTETGEDRQSSL